MTVRINSIAPSKLKLGAFAIFEKFKVNKSHADIAVNSSTSRTLQARSSGQYWRLILSVILPLFLYACGGESSDPTPPKVVDIPENHTPIAEADSATTNENTTVEINLAANDSGLEDTPLTYTLAAADHGTVSVSSGGQLSYIPAQNFIGTDSFMYTVTDVDGESATAQVSITVIASPDLIMGQVTSADQAVANATVTLLFNNSIVLSDSEGRYSIELTDELPIAEDVLALSISADGYRAREVNVELNNENSIELIAYNAYKYFPPVQLDDGIETKGLVEANVDSTLINQLMEKVVQQNESLGYKQVHSLLVYKDGALVLEEYNIGNDDFINFENNISRDRTRPDKQWSRTDKHYIASVNKALTSTVTGIALEEFGLNVDDKISTLLPQKSELFDDANKSAVSIHHMLTMQLGFAWDEWGSNDLALLWKSNDFTEFLLSRNNAGPESAWVYNSASPNMLLKGLDNTVDGGIRTWADTNFYSKLGIKDYEWIAQPDGIPEGAARMHMRPRDMLKVGITYLNNGVWNNQQVIPTSWVEKVSTVQVTPSAGDYSYFFWHRKINGIPYISADGDGGQFINIFPEQNMVVVMTQGNYLEWPLYVNQADDIMGNYILPAVAD